MYQLGIQFGVVQTILCNPDWFAENVVGNSKEIKEFKGDPTIGGMKKMLTQLCTKDTKANKLTSNSAKEKRKLMALLDSDDEGMMKAPLSKQARKNQRAERIHLLTSPSWS
jgi:inhibitor of KinA sporulation pathway (predicted exonuclease)